MKITRLLVEASIGALFVIISTSLSISNAIIEKAQFQSPYMYCASSNVSLTNFTLSEADFLDSGGLLTAESNSIVSFNSVNFTNLKSNAQGLISITWSTFLANWFTVSHFNEGFIMGEHSLLHLEDLIVQNGLIAAGNKSLALVSKGGFLHCSLCLDIIISRALIKSVSAREGGVMYIEAANSIQIANSDFIECSALTDGGVISISATSLQIDNSLFQNNSAANGGVVYARSSPCSIRSSVFFRNSAETDGSCILWVGTQPTMINNTFIENSATYGDPMASTANHFRVIDGQRAVAPSVLWVSGQSASITIGVYDAMEQLITTDNSTMIYVANLDSLNISGTTQMVTSQGLAVFTLLFTHFYSGPVEAIFTVDSVQSLTVAVSLRDCIPGEVRKSFGCYPCPMFSYSFSPDDENCKLCIPEADCLGKTDVRLAAGYWRAHNMTDDIYGCMQPRACDGGINSECSDGFEGTLCGACSSDYFQWGMWDCRPCKKQIPVGVRAMLVAMLAVIPVALAGFIRLGEKSNNRVLGARFLLNYAQTAGFAQQLSMKWKFAALMQFEILQAVGTFGSELLYFDCEFGDFPAFFGRLIATAMFPVVLAAVAMCARGLLRCCSVPMPSFFSLWAIQLYLYLPVMLMMAGASLQCTEVAGSLWLVRDLHETCFSVQHIRALLAIIPSTFLVIVLVFACYIVSKKKYGVMLEFRKFLQVGYFPGREKWELMAQARWVCLTVLIALCPRLDAMGQTVLMVAVLSTSTLVEANKRPFAAPWFIGSVLWQSAMLLFLLLSACGRQEGVGAGFLLVLTFAALCCRAQSDSHATENFSQSFVDLLEDTSKVIPACPNGSLISESQENKK